MTEELMYIRDWHQALINQVYKNDYYVNLLDYVSKKFPPASEISLKEIHSFWNQFWIGLPDSRSIHRQPFNEICEICEGNYLQGEVE